MMLKAPVPVGEEGHWMPRMGADTGWAGTMVADMPFGTEADVGTPEDWEPPTAQRKIPRLFSACW